jgi:uncharacterized protein YjbI with pentapeptide repeats
MPEKQNGQIYSFYCCFRNKIEHNSLRIRGNDFYMSSKNIGKIIYEKYLKLMEEKKDDKNFKLAKERLSQIVLKDPVIIFKSFYTMSKMRNKLNFPCMETVEGVYGDDFSLLNLTGLIITRETSKNIPPLHREITYTKGLDFIGTDLTDSNISHVYFSATCFVGAKLTNTIFTKCKFSECKFDGIIKKNIKFIDCIADKQSAESFNQQ